MKFVTCSASGTPDRPHPAPTHPNLTMYVDVNELVQ